MDRCFKTWLTCCCLLAVQFVFAQSQYEYEVHKNLPYYAQSENSYQDSQCRLDIYVPKGKQHFPVLVWFHGGGLTGGSKELPAELKNYGIGIVSVEYRFSPKVQAPAYIEDAAAGIAWVFKNIYRYGGDSSRIFLSGHSAGGYLVMMTGLDSSWLAKYHIPTSSIAGIFPLSPQVITHFTIRAERKIPEYQPQIDQYAPIYHIKKNTPPILLVTGDRELELLGRYEENAYFLRMMKQLKNPNVKLYELGGFDHVGMLKPGIHLMMKELMSLSK